MTQLPQLTGRAYELTEAALLRDEMLARLTDELIAQAGQADPAAIAALTDLYREVALRQTDADWWIQHSHYKLGPTVQRLFTADDRERLAAIASTRG